MKNNAHSKIITYKSDDRKQLLPVYSQFVSILKYRSTFDEKKIIQGDKWRRKRL